MPLFPRFDRFRQFSCLFFLVVAVIALSSESYGGVNDFVSIPDSYELRIKEVRSTELLSDLEEDLVSEKPRFAALHYAVIFRDRNAVRKLLESDHADIHVRTGTESGYTPLHLASIVGDATMVRVLLALGAKVDSVVSPDSFIDLPEKYKNRVQTSEAAKQIFCRSDLLAAFEKKEKALNALHYAILFQDREMVRELLEVDHANPNFRCALLSEYTPIQLASMQGNVEIAKLLVSHGADPLAKTAKIEEKDHTPYGRYSVLDLAVAMNQIGMMDYLHGLKIPLNSVSAEGQTPLMSAILVKNVEAVEKLLSLGVDIHAPEAGAVLAAAVWVNDPVLIKLMIQKGAKQEKHAIHGVPLHLAASRGSNEAIEVLLDAGANIQGVDRFKRSALHFAAYAGQTETVRLLLQRNADPNGYDSTGNSPAVAALMNDHFETAREIWKVSKNAAFDAINTSLQMGNISLGREIIRESYPNEKTYFNEVNSRKEALKFSRFTNQMEFNLLLGFPWLPQQGPMIHILQPLVQEIVQEKTAKINADRLKNKLAALQKGTISPYWNVLNDAILFATVQGKVQFVHLLLEAGASPVQAAEYLELVQFNPHVSVEQRKKFPEIKHLLQQACKRWRASVIGNHSMAQSYFGLLPIQDKSLKGVRADLRSVVFEKYKKSLINEYRFFSTVNSYANPPPEYVPLIKDPKRMESIPEVIRTQLKKGESFTRLHYAIIFQDLAAVRSLLESDLADVRRFTNTPERDTSVELAMKVKSSKEMIALLVTHSMKY